MLLTWMTFILLVLTGSSGSIVSPGFPSNYWNNEDFKVTVTAEKFCEITLQANAFSLPSCCDKLEISFDGIPYRTFMGSVLPPTIGFNATNFTMHFTSDESIVDRGFNFSFLLKSFTGEDVPFSYEETTNNKMDGQNSSRRVMSPNYPNDYDNNADVTYTFKSETESNVTIVIADFSTQSGKDNLTISYDGAVYGTYSGDSIVTRRLTSLTGKEIMNRDTALDGTHDFGIAAQVITFIAKEVILHFISDAITSGRGFSMTINMGPIKVSIGLNAGVSTRMDVGVVVGIGLTVMIAMTVPITSCADIVPIF